MEISIYCRIELKRLAGDLTFLEWHIEAWRINCTICNKRSKRKNKLNHEESLWVGENNSGQREDIYKYFIAASIPEVDLRGSK